VAAFTIARFVAHDAVEHLAGPRLTRIQEWIQRRGFWAVLYARIAPGVPYSMLNYVAGVTRIGLPAFAAGDVSVRGGARSAGYSCWT
jgi:uncharacterized membrane protein YdjX (TVP38/TMEM64 family)